MIALPPGVTVNCHVKIVVDKVTEDIVTWFKECGGEISHHKHHTAYGNDTTRPMVRLHSGKISYYMQDGTDRVQLDFSSEDAGFALVFLIKFRENIFAHNMKDIKEYVY